MKTPPFHDVPRHLDPDVAARVEKFLELVREMAGDRPPREDRFREMFRAAVEDADRVVREARVYGKAWAVFPRGQVPPFAGKSRFVGVDPGGPSWDVLTISPAPSEDGTPGAFDVEALAAEYARAHPNMVVTFRREPPIIFLRPALSPTYSVWARPRRAPLPPGGPNRRARRGGRGAPGKTRAVRP